MNTPNQQVDIITSPSGAECHVGNYTISTPGVLMLARTPDKYKVTCTLKGYKAASAELKRATSGWLVGNIVTGLIPGLVTDFITGAGGKLKPDILLINLEKD